MFARPLRALASLSAAASSASFWASPAATLASVGGLISPDRVEGKGRPQGAVRTLAASAPCAVVCAQKTEKRVPGMLAWVTAVIESCLPLTITSMRENAQIDINMYKKPN